MGEFRPVSRYISETVQDRNIATTCRRPIRNRIRDLSNGTVSNDLEGRKSIYIAPFCIKVHTKRSGMDHTVLPANNTMPAFPSWRSPDVTTTATEAADIQLQLTTHLSTPKG